MDPYELSLRRTLGLDTAPPEEEEGSDLFQPIRTLFGGTQGAIPAAVSPLMPEQYAAAQEEMRQNLGVDENAPWYEQAEALPGAGDVAAQFVPTEIRESLPGRVAGPVLRLAGNILGDPTTYTPAILGKAANLIAKGSKAGRVAMEGAELATRATAARAAEAASLGQISGREAVQIADQARRAGLTNVTRELMAESPIRGKAYLAARTLKEAEPYAMGTAAALAYGPQVAEGAWESGKETLAAIGEKDVEGALVSGANTILMGALGGLMAKGLISTTKARSVLTRELADQGLMPDIDKLLRERAGETGVAPDLSPIQMPPRARPMPTESRARFGEMPPVEGLPELNLPTDLMAPRQFRGRAGDVDLGALQEEVRAAGPVEGPLPLPLRSPQPEIPTGFRARVVSDAELVDRLREATERARAQAREQLQAPTQEGMAPPIELSPRMEENLAGLDIAPETFPLRPGQTVLPGMAEPRPITRPPAPPIRAKRGRAKQAALDLGEGEAIVRPPTVDDQIRAVLADPAAQSLVDEQMRQGRISMEPWRRLGEKKLRTIQKILRDPTHPDHQAEIEHLQGWAMAQVTKTLKKQIKGGLKPAEMLQKLRDDAEARGEREAIQAEAEAPVAAEPAPWDTPAPVEPEAGAQFKPGDEVVTRPGGPGVVLENLSPAYPGGPRRVRVRSKQATENGRPAEHVVSEGFVEAPPVEPTTAEPAPWETAPAPVDADIVRVSTAEGTERVPFGKFGQFNTATPDEFIAGLRREGWVERTSGSFEKDGRWVRVETAGPTTRGKMVTYGKTPPTVPPVAPRIEPVVTEPTPATPEPAPPVPEAPKTIRLYRAETRVGGKGSPDWVKGHSTFENSLAASGRWFTDDLEEAKLYLKDNPGSRLVAVDVPVDVAEPHRVSNLPRAVDGKSAAENPRAFSERPEKEFFLPKELAAAAKEAEVPVDVPKPETPVAKAMADVPPAAIPDAWKPSPEPAHRPSTPEERLARTPDQWADSVLKDPKLTPERVELLGKNRQRVVDKIKELQDTRRQEKAELGLTITEEDLRKAAYKARNLVADELAPVVKPVPKAVVKAKPVEPVVEADVLSPAGTQSQLGELGAGNLEAGAEGRAPGAGGQTGSLIRATTEGPGGLGPKAAAQARAEKGGTLSPAAAKWHDVAWPAVRESGVTIEQVLDRYPEGVIREADRLKLRSQRDKFVEFQKLYDQARLMGKTPFQARKDAIAALGGGQHLRNMIGLVERFLGDEVIKAAAASKGVEPPPTRALPVDKAGLEGLLERKRGLGRQLAAFTTKPPDKAVVQEFLSNYMALVAERKRLAGGRSMGRTTLAKELGDAELQNWAKFLDVKVPDKSSAEVVARAIAAHFGVDLTALPKPAPVRLQAPMAPVAKARVAPEGFTVLAKNVEGKQRLHVGPNGLKVKLEGTGQPGRWTVDVAPEDAGRPKSMEALTKDLDALLNDVGVTEIRGYEDVRPPEGMKAGEFRKAWGEHVDALIREGKVSVENTKDGAQFLRPVRSIAGMETTNLRDVAGNDWTKWVPQDEIMVGPEGRYSRSAEEYRALADHMAEPEDAWETVRPIAQALGLKVKWDDPVTAIGSKGYFHQLFLLNGEGPDGQRYVLRTGKSPYVELPRPDQKALVNAPVKTGEFKAVTGERFTYSVHPYAWSPGIDIMLGSLPSRDELIRKFHGYYDSGSLPSKTYENMLLQRLQGRLPDGIGLYDYLDDAARLNAELDRVGLVERDIFENRMMWRSDQTGYVKLKPGEAPSGVVRTTPDGSRYKLVVLDLGSVEPMEKRGQWANLDKANFVALQQADETLSLAQQRAMERQLFDETAQALDLGDGLVVANHHGAFGMGYAALTGKHGAGAARGMKAIFDDLVSALGPKTKVEFGGLTTSPYLRGMYAETPAGAKVFGNVVETVYHSNSYDDAVDKITYMLVHEVAHLAEKGNTHGGKFADLQRYIENLAKAEEWQAGARQKLKDAGFDEAAYRKIQEDLVDQFDEAWREIRGRDWRNPEAQGAPVEGVPARGAAGSAAAKQGVTGGGAQAPPGGGGAGLRPGRPVPGGGEREAGGVRPGAASGAGDATGPAEGGSLGSLAREGSDPTESFIAGLESRNERLTYDSAKRDLDRLVRTKAIPVTKAVENAWDISDALVKQMDDGEVAKLMKSAPDPRGRPGVIAGGINLLYDVPGVSDRGKARMVTFANLLDDAGLTARSKVRSWDKVEREVRELLGMTTPEEYVKAFQHRGGGITDTEHMALVTVRDELSRHTDYVEGQWQKAAEAGDFAASEKLFEEYRTAAKNEMAAIMLTQQKLTGAARALAVGRHERLRLDPQEMFRARLRAGILERMRTQFKDVDKARAKADELTNQFYEIQARRGSWSEFQKAMNLAMGRTGLKGNFYKVLEFYKAGLLGWPSEFANITSNGLFRASRYGEDAIAGLLDAGAYKLGELTGGKVGTKERAVFLGEAKVGLMAARDAFAEAFKPLIESEARLFKLEGGDMAKLMASGNIGLDDLMMAGGMIEGRIGNFLRFHFDSMQNWDTFAKHMAHTDSLYRDIFRGLSKGEKWLEARKKTGESLVETTRRVANEIKQNQAKLNRGEAYDGTLLHYSREMLERADKFALQDTFQAELGDAARGVQSFLREHPTLQFLIPFFRTPTNIFKETLDRTPFGFAKAAFKWKDLTPAERMQALSKPTMGSAILGTMASLAMTGEITGGGPMSFEEQEALRATGWQPYSVRIGDQWISYQRLEPVASLMGMAADAVEAGKNGDLETLSGAMQKLADSMAENLTNKTFLSGFSALTGAISDPKRELGNFVKQMQGSAVPNSLGFVPFGHLARAIDPVYREAEPMTLAAFQAKIPFASQRLPPAYGPTGEERVRPGSALERAVSPFARRAIESGPKARGSEEIVRVKAVPKAPMRYWVSPQGFRVPLKPEERQILAKALEEATTMIGQRLVNDPTYQRLPKDELDPNYRYGQMTKQDMLQRMIGRYRSRALKQIMPELKQRSRQMYREREV